MVLSLERDGLPGGSALLSVALLRRLRRSFCGAFAKEGTLDTGTSCPMPKTFIWGCGMPATRMRDRVRRGALRPLTTAALIFAALLTLAVNGGATFFSDCVNYGFSDPTIRAMLERFGGAGIEAEVQVLTDGPPIVLGNGIAESGTVLIPDGAFIIPVGDPFVIGELEGQSRLSLALGMRISELSGIIRYDIDADTNDNDVEQLP